MTSFLVYLLTMTGIYAILSISLNLQFGKGGLVNLGQVGFFMIGAYASTIAVALMGLPFLVGLVAAVVAGALFGMLLSLPTASLRADYWAIATLAGSEILRSVFLNQTLGGPYVGASYGVSGIPRPLRDYFSITGYEYFYLGLVLGSCALVFVFAIFVDRTPFGRVLKAVREDDDLPLALGKNVGSFRIRAMALGGGIAGLAGALFAHYNAFIEPNYFLPPETFIIWAMVILGGAGNYAGALLGALVLQVFFVGTRLLTDYVALDAQLVASLRIALVGFLITIVVLYMPQGILPERRRRYGDG